MSADSTPGTAGRVFDVSADAKAWYRFRLFGRYLSAIGLVVLALALVYRVAVGIPAILAPFLPVFIAVEAFVGWMAVRGLSMGPTRISVSETILRFGFDNGRVVQMPSETVSRRLEFLVPKVHALDNPGAVPIGRGFQIRRGLEVFAASMESWEAIRQWMIGAGYIVRERGGSIAGNERQSTRFVPGAPARTS